MVREFYFYFKEPRFDDTIYFYWKGRMECHLISLLIGTWESIKNRYSVLKNSSQTPDELKEHENNMKAKVSIVNSLSDALFSKVVGLNLISKFGKN